MSLFSGMRLASGKQSAKSISVKEQHEGTLTEKQSRNRNTPSLNASLSEKNKDRGGMQGAITLQKDNGSSTKLGATITEEDVCSDLMCTLISKEDKGKERDGTASLKDKGSGRDDTTGLKDRDSERDGTTGPKDRRQDDTTGLKDQESMFSFITQIQSSNSHVPDLEHADVSSNNEDSGDFEAIASKMAAPPDTFDIDAMARTTKTWYKSKDFPGLELELDPFSVNKPSFDKIIPSELMSCDLEGLDLSLVPQALPETSPEGKDTYTNSAIYSEDKDFTKLKNDVLSDQWDDEVHRDDVCNTGLVNCLADGEKDRDMAVELECDILGAEQSYLSQYVGDQKELHCKEDGEEKTSGEAPQVQLEVMQQMHTAKLRQFSEALNELMSMISAIISECVHSNTSLLQKQQTLMWIKTKQSEAVAKEDYEQAESFNDKHDTLEVELQKLPIHTIPSNHPGIQDIVDTITKVNEEKNTFHDDYLKELDALRNKQETIVEEIKSHYAKMEISTKHEFDEETSSLQRDIGHLDLDKEHLSRKEKQLEKRIDEKTCDIRQDREQLYERRTLIQEEIIELKKKLVSLNIEEQELSEQISYQENLICQAKEEFDNEIKALGVERAKVNEKDVCVGSRKEKVMLMEKRIASRLEKAKAEVMREDVILDQITQEIQKLESEMSVLDGIGIQQSVSTVLDSSEDLKLYSLQDKYKSNTAAVQSLTSQLLQAQTKIVSLRQRLSNTEGHIAALGEAKQLAVSGRNFSEAKRLANEIKELISEGHKNQTELEDTITMRDKSNRELETLKEAVVKIKTELCDEELQYDSDLKARLLQHVQTLQKGPNCHRTTSTLSRTLSEADIKSCALLIQYLCIKHDDPVPDCLQEHAVEITLEKDAGKDIHFGSTIVTTELPSSPVDSCKNPSEIYHKIQALESQLQAAVNEEDYDTAQLLQEQIEELQKL